MANVECWYSFEHEPLDDDFFRTQEEVELFNDCYYYDQATGMTVPHGCHFLPTDEELILDYLMNKVNGGALPCGAVADVEIYGEVDKEPWMLFDVKSPEMKYVFTKLKKKGKNTERKAGRGTWKGQRSDKVLDSEKNHVGTKKLFVFEIKGEKSDVNGHWIMHEYSLLCESDYVLCAIRNKNAEERGESQALIIG